MAYAKEQGLELGLNYCGLPSVEFLDVRVWSEVLRSVCAVEREDGVLGDMRLQWDTLDLGLPVPRYVHADILDFLLQDDGSFDLYNLDFYGGFLYPRRGGQSRITEAIRALITRQGRDRHSFVLIATFNVRDLGVREYLKFVDEIPGALAGWSSVAECCKAHRKNHSTLLKLCFPFFCWQIGSTNGLSAHFEDTFVYCSGKSTLVHFYGVFKHQPQPLPPLTAAHVLASFANRPLLRLDGMVPKIELNPPQIQQADKS